MCIISVYMQVQRINITLPAKLAHNLRRSVPVRSRSKFIAKAIQKELSKDSLGEQLRKSAEAQNMISREIMEDFKYADADVLKRLP